MTWDMNMTKDMGYNSRGFVPMSIIVNISPLGSWGVAPGYINLAPLGLIINH